MLNSVFVKSNIRLGFLFIRIFYYAHIQFTFNQIIIRKIHRYMIIEYS